MSQTKMSRDITVMIGVGFSGKSHYVDTKFLHGPHQIISLNHIRAAYKTTKLKNPDIVYATMDLIARSHIIKGLPIIIDESNLTIESLFLWKSIAREFGYALNGIVMDTKLEVCKDRIKASVDGTVIKSVFDSLDAEYEIFEELKMILNMKHQHVLDKVTFITYNGGK